MKNFIVSVAPGGRISIVKLGAGEVAIPIVSEAWGGDDSHLSHRLAMDCGNRYVFESCQSLIPKSVLTSRLEKFTCAFPPDCESRYVFERCQSLTPNSALTSRL